MSLTCLLAGREDSFCSLYNPELVTTLNNVCIYCCQSSLIMLYLLFIIWFGNVLHYIGIVWICLGGISYRLTEVYVIQSLLWIDFLFIICKFIVEGIFLLHTPKIHKHIMTICNAGLFLINLLKLIIDAREEKLL